MTKSKFKACYQPRHLPKEGEIPFGAWIATRAQQLGCSEMTLRRYLDSGKEPMPKIRKVNARVLYVSL